MFTPTTDPIAGSVAISALVALVPLLTFFILLAVIKTKAHVAGLGSLAVAILVAIFGWNMPVGMALNSGVMGMVFGAFPIVWIVVMAIFLYQVTVVSGRFEDLRRVFDVIGGGDVRIQAVLIAFCFGGLLEALAGFGAPVAITATMLLALGLSPLRAACAVLIANTAPVAFGAVAIPITTAGALTGIPSAEIGAVAIAPAPRRAVARGRILTAEAAALPIEHGKKLNPSNTWMALFPYLLVILIFGVAKLWKLGVDIPAWLAGTDIKFGWPGLHGAVVDANGEAVSSTIYNFSWLSSPGTLLLITGTIVALVYSMNDGGGKYKMTFGRGMAEVWHTIYNMRYAALTILSVLGLAYVMNLSGQTITVGTWLAGTGAFFAFLSPILGWIGTAVTGSDTSANALFAKLQQTAGMNAGIDPTLLVAANTSGGVVGKLISPQNLAIAATAVKMEGQESVILKKVAGWSVGMLLVLCVLVYLQSTPVLSWMLP